MSPPGRPKGEHCSARHDGTPVNPLPASLPGAFVRYAGVGVVATAAHYALLAACVEWAGWPAWLGAGLGAVLGAQVAFFGNRRFTFGHRGALTPAWRRFQGTAIASALLGMAVVAAGVAAGLHYVVAQVLATLLSLVATFVVNRRWTFAGPADPD